jgi:hypothetical protein
VARERRAGMSGQSNALGGWATFRALRKPPLPISHRQHGNWIHGRYSKARIEGMREFRRLARTLRVRSKMKQLHSDGQESP